MASQHEAAKMAARLWKLHHDGHAATAAEAVAARERAHQVAQATTVQDRQERDK